DEAPGGNPERNEELPADFAAPWRGTEDGSADDDGDRSPAAPDLPTLRDHLNGELALTNLGTRDRALVGLLRADAVVVPLARADLDITDDDAVAVRIGAERPDVIINCASDNDVDGAEAHARRALEVNAFAVRELARAANHVGATLIHYSSDFVFDGTSARPYVESDEPNPLGVYAASKLLGEWFALEARRGLVLRVESLFGAVPGKPGRRSSIDAIAEGIEAGREVPVFTDRTVSPSYVFDIAEATRAVLVSQAPPGVYHCVNAGACTWHDIAVEIARLLGRRPVLKPITLETAALRAPRPKYCALDNSRLRALGIPMPTWQDALARHLHASGPA
ncbi:MAG: sugar nucleotide-binding protein, partial [Acidobacteria bacterium]|nr:sugar nucleotide-binding protein [Acidobacteriota bacterium]